MKYLLLISLLFLLLVPSIALAQDEPPTVVLEEAEPTPQEDELLYWDAVEAWAKSSLAIFLASGAIIAASVSTVKTVILAPLRSNVEFFRLRIYHDITVYEVAVLGLVVLIAALEYAADMNPFPNSPVTWISALPEVVQALATVAITAYLSVASHELLDKLRKASS